MKGRENNGIIADQLSQYKFRLYDLSRSNPFVNVKPSHLFFDSENDEGLHKIYQKATFYKKEFGLSTTLRVHSFLRWKDPTKDYFYTSPLVIQQCSISRVRKIETSYLVKEQEDELAFVNPILLHFLNHFFDINLADVPIEDVETLLKKQLEVKTTKIPISNEWNNDEHWQIIASSAVGNFNYKKSLLGQDFDKIIAEPNQLMMKVLGFDQENVERIDFDISPIITLDASQEIVIKKATQENVVVQGPPGTGKSHSIIGMIGEFLLQGKKVLFVSQKKSALDVVYNRLEKLDLGHLAAYLNTEKDEKKEFFGSLKKSWEKYSHMELPNNSHRLQAESGLLKFYVDEFLSSDERLLNRPLEIVEDLCKSNFTKKDLKVEGKIPALKDWQKSKDFLLDFEGKIGQHLGYKSLNEARFTQLNRSVFSEKDPVAKLESRLLKCLSILDEISLILKKHQLSNSMSDMTRLAIAASILNMVNKVQLDLLNVESSKYKSFGNWAKKYEVLKVKLAHCEKANSKWKNKPTKSEISELTDLLKHHEAPKGIFGMLKRRSQTLVEAFDSFDNQLSKEAKLQLLEQLRTEWNIKAELDEVIVKLKHNFGIIDPENEVGQILKLRNKLSQIQKSDYLQILESPDSIELINDLNSLHPSIQNYNHLTKFIFKRITDRTVDEEVLYVQSVIEQLGTIKLFETDLLRYFNLPGEVQNFICNNDRTVKFLDACCNYFGLVEHFKYNSSFANLSANDLEKSLQMLAENKSQNSSLNQQRLVQLYYNRWKENETLLGTPASKLKEGKKELKKLLKLQKRGFIHEINKKQRHQSVKQFSHENWSFTTSMIPLWLMNPLAVSEKLPFEKDLFDVVIFDESSQIPIEDAIPSIQRARQIVIVGDDHQMPPSSFFKNSSSSETLLDVGGSTLQKYMLKWHYRSEHPSLIDFSNQYFYQNELITIPPVNNKTPIRIEQVNGFFEDNVNKVEAKEIAKYLSVNSDLNKSNIAVVAFSKSQENEIRKQLLTEKINTEELLISNLENVQGIERGTVIISIGYAPNKEGVFRLNFGPVNQEGGKNRLNVLFSRAKKEMIIYSSVKSSDFGLSDNQGVTCLKDFLFYAENLGSSGAKNKEQESIIDFVKYNLDNYSPTANSGLSCFIQKRTNRLLILDPGGGEHESQDLVTAYSVIKERFSNFKIMLSIDYFNDPEKFNRELDTFFK